MAEEKAELDKRNLKFRRRHEVIFILEVNLTNGKDNVCGEQIREAQHDIK